MRAALEEFNLSCMEMRRCNLIAANGSRFDWAHRRQANPLNENNESFYCCYFFSALIGRILMLRKDTCP
jgi:hypothetical protein